MTDINPSPRPTAVDIPAGTYRLDPAATTLAFDTKAMFGLAKVHGTIKATEGHGTIGDDGTVSGEIVLDASSVDTGTKKRDQHLRTKDFFDVDAHPTFTYNATGARKDGGDTYLISGTLTAAGHTRELELKATVAASGGRLTVTGTADLDRSAWGMRWSKMGARLDNKITVTAVFGRV